MKKQKKRILLITMVLVVLVSGALILRLLPMILTHEKTVDGRVLVVEGWMPASGLRRAYYEFTRGDYDLMLITGNTLEDYITLYVNSYLIIYPPSEIQEDPFCGEIEITLQAGSSLGAGDSAHFAFWINDNRIASFYTTQNRGKYSILWEGCMQNIDSLMIQYDNDKVGPMGDRNLQIRDLQVHGHRLLDKQTQMILDKGRPFGRFRWPVKAYSYAEMASHYFLESGLNANQVIAITNYHDDKRRTLGNALALREWLEENNLQPEALNVVSIHYHSRRTWKVYQQVLGDDIQVGIISAEPLAHEKARRQKLQYIAKEFVAYLYYLFFVFPFL